MSLLLYFSFLSRLRVHFMINITYISFSYKFNLQKLLLEVTFLAIPSSSNLTLTEWSSFSRFTDWLSCSIFLLLVISLECFQGGLSVHIAHRSCLARLLLNFLDPIFNEDSRAFSTCSSNFVSSLESSKTFVQLYI